MEVSSLCQGECHEPDCECLRVAVLATEQGTEPVQQWMAGFEPISLPSADGSFNALSTLPKTVQRANQVEENENAEPIAFIVFRRSKPDAVRKWTGAGSGASSSSRMKLSNYLNRQFTDHISIHDWDGTGDHQLHGE